MAPIQTAKVDDPAMSVEEALAHYGVKGMKWGVRKDENRSDTPRQRYREIRSRHLEKLTVKLRSGQTLDIEETLEPRFVSFVAAFNKSTQKAVRDSKHFDLKVEGKRVGQAAFDRVSDEDMSLNWLGVHPKEQGKGYGSAVMEAAVQYGRKTGAKRLTLEVPGTAPNARHIYEKHGFVAGKTTGHLNDLWGGLTEMTLDLSKSVVKHSETDELEQALLETFPQMPEELDVSGLSVEDAMAHYGVKGMKWGVRKDDYSKMTRGEKRQTKQDFKADAKWEKKYGSTKFKVEMYNDIADQINARIGAINDKYKDKDIRDWSSGDGLEYVNEYKALAQRSAENSLKRMVPDSPSGKYTTRVELDPLKEMFPRIYLVEKEVKHADDEPFEMEIWFIWKNNRIVKVKPVTIEDLAHSLFLEGHSEDDVMDILAHYGVKGMKWGVRNPVGPNGLVTKAASRISEANATRKANNEAKAGRTLVKTAKDLDLADLQKKVKRLELEKKYVSLSNDLNIMSETSWQKFRRETLDTQKRKVANDPGVARAVESVIRRAILSKVGAVK